jgi:lysophospholipase L1-like esterase
VDAGHFLVDVQGNLADEYHDGDGVHLNPKGNGIWIRELQKTIMSAQQGAALDGDSAVLHPRQ